MIFILLIGLFLAVYLLRYIQRKKYKTDSARFRKRRDKFEDLLQTLKRNKTGNS